MFARRCPWRHIAGALLVALIIVLSPPASPVNAQTALPLIRVGAGPDEQSIVLVYAVQAGIYKKYGLNVELVKMPGGSVVAAALAGGSLEIGKTTMLGGITAFAKGVPFTAIGSIGYTDADNPDFALLVPASSSIRTAKDLEGKTFAAVSLQDGNSIATYAWLEKNGVDLSSIKYVEIPASATLAAMEQGRVAASTLYEPFLSAFLATGKVRILANPYEAIGKHFTNGALFADVKWAAEHRDQVDKFLRATQESAAYVGAHEKEVAPLSAQFGGLDPSLVLNMRHARRGVSLVPADVQPLIDVAVKYKIIPKTFPAQELICTCALH